MPRSKDARIALVTGAAGGLGSETCRELARRGCVLVLAGPALAPLRHLADELGMAGATAHTLRLDVADAASIGRARAFIDATFGGRLDMPLMTFPGQGISICGNFVGNPRELREVVELARSGRLKPIPVERRPKSEATRTLQELRDGRITGRVVLEG